MNFRWNISNPVKLRRLLIFDVRLILDFSHISEEITQTIFETLKHSETAATLFRSLIIII